MLSLPAHYENTRSLSDKMATQHLHVGYSLGRANDCGNRDLALFESIEESLEV